MSKELTSKVNKLQECYDFINKKYDESGRPSKIEIDGKQVPPYPMYSAQFHKFIRKFDYNFMNITQDKLEELYDLFDKSGENTQEALITFANNFGK